ncbi:hypothetical protein BLNAU_8518 [Blattamonas nauphoetae]|uniref:Uncharacterized protein n=1 Tax=Blattamonas nauphoetae TaxID=2049346 RepID=A0ABQ9XYD4_9EUKA|nr:hypothetical protein BLNAU_8518 [Blattamonas nauphoetae]
MESDVEKKDSKTVVIPKEVKSPEPSQNKIEQEHTVALVVTLTDQTMAESIGEENKESTKQVEKKEEPKIQDNEILYENNGREEFIIDTRIQHFPPHDNAPTKSTSTPSLVVSSHFVAMTWISPIARRLDIGLDIATSTGHSLTGQQDSRCRVQIPPCPIESEWGKEGTNEYPSLPYSSHHSTSVCAFSIKPTERAVGDRCRSVDCIARVARLHVHLGAVFPVRLLSAVAVDPNNHLPTCPKAESELGITIGEQLVCGSAECGRRTSFRPSTKDSPVNLLSSFLPIHRLHHTLFNPSLENQNVHCPSTDGSCAGLVDSISISLGSAFPKLGKSALHLLDATLRLASDDDRIRVAESSLLSQVLPKFMHSDLTTSASVPMCLIRIVMTLLELSIETRKISVVGLSEEAVVGIHQTVFDNILVPSAGFVLVLFRQRYSVSPHEDFVHFAGLLSTLFKIAKFRASASTHAFPLPLSLLLTGCLMSLEPTSHIHSILLIVSDSFRRWTNDAQEETKMQQGAFWRDAESEGFEDIAESMRLLADI